MPDEPEDRLSRADIHALENRIVSLEVKIASLPTRRDLTRVAFLALLAGAALVLVGIEVLPPLLSKITPRRDTSAVTFGTTRYVATVAARHRLAEAAEAHRAEARRR